MTACSASMGSFRDLIGHWNVHLLQRVQHLIVIARSWQLDIDSLSCFHLTDLLLHLLHLLRKHLVFILQVLDVTTHLLCILLRVKITRGELRMHLRRIKEQ